MKPRAEGPNGVDEAVARILDGMKLEDPPEDLKPNVLRAIGTRPEPARSGWFEALRAGLRERFFAPMVPFAAGAAAGVLVFALASGTGVRGSGSGAVSGVMAPWSGPSSAAGVKVDDQRFELGRANVRLEVVRSGERVGISIQSDAAEPVAITLQVAPGVARVERIRSAPTASGGVEYGPGWIRVRSLGQGRTDLGLVMESGAGDAPIRVDITSRGGTVQGALRAAAEPGGAAGAAGSGK